MHADEDTLNKFPLCKHQTVSNLAESLLFPAMLIAVSCIRQDIAKLNVNKKL